MKYRLVQEFDRSSGKPYWSTESSRLGLLWLYVSDSLSYDKEEALKRYHRILATPPRGKVVLMENH